MSVAISVQKRSLAGIPIAMSSLDDAVRNICAEAKAGGAGLDIHLLNAYSIFLSDRDPVYQKCLGGASRNYPDGKPLSLITTMTATPLSQVRGPSLFERVIADGRPIGLRHFLLGGTQETLVALEASLRTRHPGVQIVGTLSPPFRDLTPGELERQDVDIKRTNPDIVWVGLGTPKQDFEAQRLAQEGGFLAIAVGAAFDFSAGTKKEAPKWMSQVSLEWVYRLASEPRRLWKRYLFGNVGFLAAVLRGNRK